MCMISAPDSVSWSWATSISSGPMPAISNAPLAAADGGAVASLDRQPRAEHLERAEGRERNAAARRYTGAYV